MNPIEVHVLPPKVVAVGVQQTKPLGIGLPENLAPIKGDDGVTYTPHIEGGVLSWTNDGGRENPDPVDIRGPAYDDSQLRLELFELRALLLHIKEIIEEGKLDVSTCEKIEQIIVEYFETKSVEEVER